MAVTVNHLYLPAVIALTSSWTPVPGLVLGVGLTGLRPADFALAHFHVENLTFSKLS